MEKTNKIGGDVKTMTILEELSITTHQLQEMDVIRVRCRYDREANFIWSLLTMSDDNCKRIGIPSVED